MGNVGRRPTSGAREREAERREYLSAVHLLYASAPDPRMSDYTQDPPHTPQPSSSHPKAIRGDMSGGREHVFD